MVYAIEFTENEIRSLSSNMTSVRAMAREWMTVSDPFDSAHSKLDMMVAFLNDKVAYADELAAVAVDD